MLSVTSIGNAAFQNCDALKSISIPTGIVNIKRSVFAGCRNLVSVNIPSGVEVIEKSAFQDCKALSSVAFPDSINIIGSYAFARCSGLKSVTIPNSVNYLGSYAFSDCDGLTSVVIPSNVIKLRKRTFWSCTNLKWLKLSPGIKEIGPMAFEYCRNLVSVTIPSSVISIRKGAFYGCKSMVSVSLSYGLEIIEKCAFGMCDRLYSISLPNSVIKMGDFLNNGYSIPFHIFIHMGTRRKFERLLPMHKDELIEQRNDARYLGTIITSEEVDEYEHLVGITDEYGAVYSSDGLRLLEVDNDVISSYQIRPGTKAICDRAFSRCKSLHSVVIPSSVINIGVNPFANTNVREVLCNSSFLVVENHALLCNDKKVLISYIGNDVDYTISNSVEKVFDSAFEGSQLLESIYVPNSVRYIGNYAFARCTSLKSIKLPIQLSKIKDYLFEECYSLQSIIIPEKVFSIGTGSFSWCESLETITIPERMLIIGSCAFSNCKSLKSVIFIPKFVNSFSDLFDGCDSLQTIETPQGAYEKYERYFYDYKEIIKEKVVVDNHNGLKRVLSKKELEVVNRAKVVQGQYTKLVCFYMNDGSQKYIPLSKQSDLSIGDEVDLNKAKLIEFDDEGIYYGLHVDGYDDVQKYLVEA